MEKDGDLRTYESSLRNNPKIRIIVNENDFLLAAEDLEWLRGTFGADRLTVFPRGGHLGNLSNPEVQKKFLEAVSDLR
jgi:hypothetical protein